MFGWLFKNKEPENYEALLSNLASDIADRRARLADIRQRQRRAAFWLTVYAGATWVAYVALWYAKLVPNIRSGRQNTLDRVLKGVPVLAGPILIIFARRIMEAWYTRIGNAEEATLKKLIVKQRETIEDIKKKTNYYSTKNLLERYDEAGTPRKAPPPPGAPGAPRQQQKPSQPGVLLPRPAQTSPQHPGRAPPPAVNLFHPVQQPVTPTKRQWYDRFADAVLGEDAEGGSGKYALICGKCFAHNGLVKEEIWSQTKYTCPKCGFFNDAPASKGSPSTSRLSSSVSSPVLGPGDGPNIGAGISSSTTMPALRASIGSLRGHSPLSSNVQGGDDVDEQEEEEAVEGEVDP